MNNDPMTRMITQALAKQEKVASADQLAELKKAIVKITKGGKAFRHAQTKAKQAAFMDRMRQKHRLAKATAGQDLEISDGLETT